MIVPRLISSTGFNARGGLVPQIYLYILQIKLHAIYTYDTVDFPIGYSFILYLMFSGQVSPGLKTHELPPVHLTTTVCVHPLKLRAQQLLLVFRHVMALHLAVLPLLVTDKF